MIYRAAIAQIKMSFSLNESIQHHTKDMDDENSKVFLDNQETTTFETLREQFVRPEEQTSIFEDNVQEILEMNAAIAMLKNATWLDPLASAEVTAKDDVQKQHGNDEDLHQRTDAVLAKLAKDNNDDVLYDSDGNPLEWNDYEVIHFN